MSGGRGILKTTSGFQLLTYWTLRSPWPGEGLYTGPYHNQIKRAVWNEVNVWLENQPRKIKVSENGTDLTIKLVTGRWLSFLGLDKFDRTRGIHPVAGVHDEVARSKVQAFNEVIEPAMRSHRGPELDITTPRGANWWKSRWLEGLDPKAPEVASWKIKAADVGMVSPEDLAKERARMSPEMFAQEWEGEFTGAAGPIFPEYIEKPWPLGHQIPPGVVRQVQREGGYALGCLDWAYSGTAVMLWLWVTKAGGVIVLDELCCSRKTPAQMATMMVAKRAVPPMIAVDHRCWGLERDGRNVADEFQRALRNRSRLFQADKRFEASVVKINDLMTLTGDDAFPRFGIESGKAPQLIRELKELQEEDVRPGGGGFRDHIDCDAVDALRYGVMAVRSGQGPIVLDNRKKGPLWHQGIHGRPGIRDDITGWDELTGEPRWGNA